MCLFAFGVGLLTLVQPAHAKDHKGVYDDLGNEYGIYIAPLEHGQMVVMSERRTDILNMARQYTHDTIVAKLVEREFGQYLRAGAGVIRADLADANTLLHLPTHAYLAHDRAILARMKDIAPNSAAARLADEVDAQLIRDQGSSLSLCQYSTLSFNTNSYVGPDWKLIDAGILMQLAAVLATAIALCMTALMTLTKRRHYKPTF
ncbi:MAG: hypothetical protein DI585_06035 [Pseudomonas fluorescens]|nr:MAG: hypothetical protein DI585_06035 [Pseudomonas fluorescens]